MILHRDPYLMHLVKITLEVAGLSTGIALLVGLPVGLAIGLGRFRGRGTSLVIANSGLGLPPIQNVKNVHPADSTSPEVVQIESAMGAAIEVFAGATAIGVGRERFLPVKTTSDLMLLRSDVYDVTPDGRLDRVADPAPLVDLDSRFYKTIAKFDSRFPDGVPSLKAAASLAVEGDWTFEGDVTVTGVARLSDPGEPATVSAGSVLDG